jgi:hypothetical protein
MTYNKKRKIARTKIESLEDRRLMSSVALLDGVLQVQGDLQMSNRISLSLSSDGTQIQANMGRGLVQKVAAAEVRSIEVKGGMLADRIVIDPKIEIYASIYGDGGNDSIRAGGGADTVYGGAGNDQILVSYADTVVDSEGSNVIVRTGSPSVTTPVSTLNSTVSSSSRVSLDEFTSLLGAANTTAPTTSDSAAAASTSTASASTTTDQTANQASTADTNLFSANTMTLSATSSSGNAIDSLTLYDAVNSNSLGTMTNGMTINLATLAHRQLNIRAEVGSGTKSVKFGLDGNANYAVENYYPYMIAGDAGMENLKDWTPSVGTHTLTVTGYSDLSNTGTASTPLTLTFTVVDQAITPPATSTTPVINSVTLLDGEHDQVISTLTNGSTIDLAKLPSRGLNLRAEANSYVKSVKFGYDSNSNYHMENFAPFTFAGDSGPTDFWQWTPSVGTHTVTVTGYSAGSATGTASAPVTITFTVIDSSTSVPTTPPATPPPTTPPTGDVPATDGNVAPIVSFINPVNDEQQAYPGHYVIRANASDSDGKVAKVEFFANGISLGSTVDTPYSVPWVNVAAGNYTLTARATDDDGATKTTAITVTITPPTVGDTFYVSTSGSDNNTGSSSSPFRSIGKAANLAGPGDTVIIRAGTYRESISLKNNGTATAPITFKAEQAGTVFIDGADVLSGWQSEGSNVYSTAWNYDFFYDKNGSRTNTSETDVGYAEAFFYQNQPLKQVFSQSALSAGEFYVNWSTNRAYVSLPGGADARSTTVLGSTRSTFFTPSSSTTGKYITIDGLVMTHAANFAQRPALVTSDGWVLKNSQIEWTSAAGLGFYGKDNFIYNNKFNNNGQEGLMGQGVDTLMVNNEVYGNNWKGFRISWEAGGGKLTRTDGLYVLNHNTHDNIGPGFWLDVTNTDYVISGGFFHDNRGLNEVWQGIGLQIEINAGPGRLQGASFYGNTGAGLSIDESQNVVVRGNYFNDDLEMRNMTGRAYEIKNITIMSNQFKSAVIKNSIGSWTNLSFIADNIKSDYNRFDNGGGAAYYWLGTSYKDVASIFSALKVEYHGVFGSVTIPMA